MTTETKRVQLIKKLENHLRMTARYLVKFDTEEETLQYLTDSFQSKLGCDFVGIILKEEDYLTPKVWSGERTSLKESFPLKTNWCSPALFTECLTYDNKGEETCQFLNILQREAVKTWFTVPLQDEATNYGFCVIGYIEYTPLLQEMRQIFEEFGKDVAVALSLAKHKEAQRKKMMGMEWITDNLSVDESLENLVAKLVERAGKGTQAKLAGIYLYNEQENCFTFQPPSYGDFTKPQKIWIEENYVLKDHFPYIEAPGGDQLTVPLVINLKTIGVLHVEHKQDDGWGVFTKEDLEVLELLANHVASMLENARLYHNEKDHKQRLHDLLDYQQKLVKETVEKDNFDGITTTISKLFARPVILFDRFMRPISYELSMSEDLNLENMSEQATKTVFGRQEEPLWLPIEGEFNRKISVWKVDGGGDLLGYLAIDLTKEEMDDFDRLTIDLVRNIYSIQFIKQKLVLDAKEQVKDSFINQLLVENIEDEDSIIQYANLFQWNLFKEHRVAVLSIHLDEHEVKDSDILEQQTKKSLLLEQLKTRISMYEREVLLANKGEHYVMIAPIDKEENNPSYYWGKLNQNIQKWLQAGNVACHAFIGIGGKTSSMQDYYTCYQEAVQALNVVTHRNDNVQHAFFEQLGSYTLLHHLKHVSAAPLFMKNHLEPLRKYSEGKNMDLFETLKVYLQKNGNIKHASEELFIHRSSLLYRLEKIEDILGMNINDAEQRFDLMMAYKLYELFEMKR